MRTLDDMQRILYGHRWESCEEWARAVAQLADLTDEEILSVAGSSDNGSLSTD
jgi:hypothetical protein